MAAHEGRALWRWQHARDDAPPLVAEPIDFQDIEGWDTDDHAAAFACYVMSAAPPLPVPAVEEHSRLQNSPALARHFFEAHFRPFRISAEPGLLTSYFEPVLQGSRLRSSAFPVPVYRRPPDLVPLPIADSLRSAGLTAAKQTPKGFVPYATRAAIDDGALEGLGLELMFLSDPIDAFIMHVQGSGLVQLEQGGEARLTFDGKNGHPYTSIAKQLVARGDLALADAHLDGMVKWLRFHPAPTTVLQANESYIFFKELPPGETGPRGSSGAPLTEGRSLAADPLYHDAGMPIWLEAPTLSFDGKPLSRLVVVQDSGSAIVGPQRGDIFAGQGAGAGRIAGRIRHACTFIQLRPRL